MEAGEISAAAAMAALANEQDNIANNLANIQSPAYKRKVGRFVEYLSDLQAADGSPLTVPVFTQNVDFSQGDVKVTGNDLDLALIGKGFFQVRTPFGIRYTRVGSLHPNRKGELCTPSGYQILATDGQPIRINLAEGEGSQIMVDPVGSVRTKSGNLLGVLGIYTFKDPQKLTPQGEGIYAAPPEARPYPATECKVEQGALESANANPIEELVTMLVTKRSFEAAAKSLVQVQKARDSFLAAARQ